MREEVVSTQQRWALFRFSVVSQLLASPPPKGHLRAAIEELVGQTWEHPISGEPCQFGFSTIERWYLKARAHPADPVGALRKKVRSDYGTHFSLGAPLREALHQQYRKHPGWSYMLHHDNLGALVRADSSLGSLPSYSTLLRHMKGAGLLKRRRPSSRHTKEARRAEVRLAKREVRSFEVPYVGQLWHLDYHVCSRPVLTPGGAWVHPQLFVALDDHSRLICHAQWYLHERAANTVHGLCQAFGKRGICAGLMHDNGKAETAAEVQQGLGRLGTDSEPTLAYSAYQNGKLEVVWALVEGRLVPMLENRRDLTLRELNLATCAWVELEYQQHEHSETGQPPMERFLDGESVLRECPPSDVLRRTFGRQESRRQRRSDGSVSIGGVRFEIPSRYRTLTDVVVRYCEWDLSLVHMIDPRTETVLCRIYPTDRAANADGARRALEPTGHADLLEAPPPDEVAPLLAELIARYAETGLPPAYIPRDEEDSIMDPEDTQDNQKKEE